MKRMYAMVTRSQLNTVDRGFVTDLRDTLDTYGAPGDPFRDALDRSELNRVAHLVADRWEGRESTNGRYSAKYTVEMDWTTNTATVTRFGEQTLICQVRML